MNDKEFNQYEAETSFFKHTVQRTDNKILR